MTKPLIEGHITGTIELDLYGYSLPKELQAMLLESGQTSQPFLITLGGLEFDAYCTLTEWKDVDAPALSSLRAKIRVSLKR